MTNKGWIRSPGFLCVGFWSVFQNVVGFGTIKKKYGPTILLDGDRLRKILKLNGYSYKERLSNTKIYNQIVKFITDQNINVIISLVGLMHIPRNWNRKNIKKYPSHLMTLDIFRKQTSFLKYG